ncbi:MAG: hypothetical protein QOF25_4752, partial [Mycobacterium sp.]|nr:hypothetical protein [Mycobacterium sp.]
ALFLAVTRVAKLVVQPAPTHSVNAKGAKHHD